MFSKGEKMRQTRIFVTISLLLLVALSACGSPSTPQQAPTDVATELPTAMLETATAEMPVETATTEAMPTLESTATTSSSIPVTGSGLGVKLEDVKSVMQG